MTAFRKKLVSEIGRKHISQHPFYRLWKEGKLSIEHLQTYAKQYHKFVRSFPRFVASVYSSCHDADTRRRILGNLIEEETGNFEKPHDELWLQFAEALAVKKKHVILSEEFKETNEAVKAFESLSKKSLIEGAACLLSYEFQIPEIARLKKEGLKKFYGIKGKKSLEFFDKHQEVDIEHSKVWLDLLEKFARTKGDRRAAIKSLRQGLEAQWLLLDGVMKNIDVAC
ncbi:MAG: CADD family putative folate metabolism protein [Candidatus Aenigmarchaeota archaeon]|nr:CADD family putative folate metabolism protein [Candidatus Aenigmarchaeota archaeon]